jgi:lipopolysaccharide assembly protein A
MRYFTWIFRAVLFIALLGFAYKNGQSVTLSFFFGYEWQSTLVIVLLVFFSAGAVTGILAMLPYVLKKSREIAVMKRDIRAKNKQAEIGETKQEHT